MAPVPQGLKDLNLQESNHLMQLETLASALYSGFCSWRSEHPLNDPTPEDYHKDEQGRLDFYRTTLEKYVHAFLTINYGGRLDLHWRNHTFPAKSRHAFVIVERRCDPYWWFLLRNLAWAGPNFSLYIFCSSENYMFLQTLLGDKQKTVHLIEWFKEPATRAEGKVLTNKTFKSAEFYKQIDAEYMLRVELDTYLCRKVPADIFQGDFYGAPWGWDPEAPGGGGLTVRKISSMITLCERETEPPDGSGEDNWLGTRLRQQGFAIPPYEFRRCVFVENQPIGVTPLGVHQFWTFIENMNIEHCPTFMQHLQQLVTLVGL